MDDQNIDSSSTPLPVAREMGTLEKAPHVELDRLDSSASTPLSEEGGNEYLPSFLAETSSYVTQYIQGADQKAIFLFSIASAILAFLHQDGASEYWLKPIASWNLLSTITFIAMFSLATSIIISISVVKPRLPGSEKGLVSFLGIANYGNPDEYAADLARTSRSALLTEKSRHCHILASICRRKYTLLTYAIILEAIGLTTSVFYFLFARI
jgi:hypothetical protein